MQGPKIRNKIKVSKGLNNWLNRSFCLFLHEEAHSKKLFSLVFLSLMLLLQHSISAQCINPFPSMSVPAPTNALVTISICQTAEEFHGITSVPASTTYISDTDLIGGFITVRLDNPFGPVIATGFAPLTWTSTVAGTYYVHLNTNSICGTDFNCQVVSIQNICSLAAPTSISATPSSLCANTSCNLRAVSPGNTIQWFTSPAGGTPIGTSSSGANFAVNPPATATYYAAAFNGSCAGPRTAVTVTVSPSPTVLGIQANPDTICLGDLSNLSASSCGTISGFAGIYAPYVWTITHTPITDQGTLHANGAPNFIVLESSDGGNSGAHSVIMTTTIPCNGVLSFDWSYFTNDIDGSDFDFPEYAIDGIYIGQLPGFVQGGAISQSGTFSISLNAGQTFSLMMTADDDVLGPATITVSNFVAPAGTNSATFNWFTSPFGGIPIGSSNNNSTLQVLPTTTTTYYAESTLNGCTSARVPVQVVVESCVLPISEILLSGLTRDRKHHLYWSNSLENEGYIFNLQRKNREGNYVSLSQITQGEIESGELNYAYIDQNPGFGTQVYRLEYLTGNGEILYSNEVHLNLESTAENYAFFPNPTRNLINFEFEASEGESYEVEVLDVCGKVLKFSSFSAEIGINQYPISLEKYSAGTYFIHVRNINSGKSYREKVLKY